MRTHLGTVGACLVVAAGWMAVAVAQSTLASVGVPEASARKDIVYALVNGRVNVYPAAKAFKAAAPATRAALVKGAFEWARAYTETPAFKAQYEQERASAAPKPPAQKSVDGELARQKAESQKAAEETKKALAQMPPEVRAQVEAAMRQAAAVQAQQEADPQLAGLMRQGTQMQIADEQKRYQESVARHDQRYPADPRALVASRLRQFLDVSKDVDFGAALVPAGTRQRFANPAYEAKSAEWKLCYRAGKDATLAAREAAQAWLAALAR